jgi:predicted metal-dependent hydrolase
MSETIEIGDLIFEVRRSPRRRTLSLTVDRGGELVIHSPVAATAQELERWARSKLLWVHRKLALKEGLAPKHRGPEFVSGESFSYLGRSYRLAIGAEQEESLRFDGRRFYLRRDARMGASEHFRRWYISAGKDWLARRVQWLARTTGRSPTCIEVRDLGFRWGSCGRSGGALFNWRLLQLPVRLVDYVIVHELTHLIEPHHGPTFWRALDRSLPDWRDRREELRMKAQEVYWCRPGMMQ